MAIMTVPFPTENENGKEFGDIILNDKNAIETQLLYCRYAKTDEENGVTTIDITKVPRMPQMNDMFYVSSKEPIETWIGCDVYDFEVKDGFATYAVRPISNLMKFDNV